MIRYTPSLVMLGLALSCAACAGAWLHLQRPEGYVAAFACAVCWLVAVSTWPTPPTKTDKDKNP